MSGGQTNEQQVELLTTTLDAKLNGYEAILSKQTYLSGDVSIELYFKRRVTLTPFGCVGVHSR